MTVTGIRRSRPADAATLGAEAWPGSMGWRRLTEMKRGAAADLRVGEMHEEALRLIGRWMAAGRHERAARRGLQPDRRGTKAPLPGRAWAVTDGLPPRTTVRGRPAALRRTCWAIVLPEPGSRGAAPRRPAAGPCGRSGGVRRTRKGCAVPQTGPCSAPKADHRTVLSVPRTSRPGCGRALTVAERDPRLRRRSGQTVERGPPAERTCTASSRGPHIEQGPVLEAEGHACRRRHREVPAGGTRLP